MGKRQYTNNDIYFSQVDSEEKAYWLGYLYADGCIYHQSVRLSSIDLPHLIRFKQALSATSPIRYLRDTFRIQIHSPILVADLRKQGCTPRKTFTLSFPILRDHLVRHFIRGFFDGDGWVCSHSRGGGEAGVYSASIVFRNKLDNVIATTLYTSPRAHRNRIVYRGKEHLKALYRMLYHNSHIYLPRKKDKFYSLVEGAK